MSDNYQKLKKQLDLQDWPSVYFFKFIVENSPANWAKVSSLFNDGTDLRIQPSKNGKYISISSKELMLDVDSVLKKYNEASLIKGLIAL